MSSLQQLRQSELFSGENWSTIYKAFVAVNLNAYDFDSIRQSMVDYIQRNHPESFTDWISSSEFVMIIDLLAYLGQSLAFRIDLNSRENFLDTAERRESILKLARMLNYAPKRNFPARGVLKLTKVKTDQEIRTSDGVNLANLDINWNDATNTNWLEQFIAVLNNAFSKTNPFGLPMKQGLIGGINTQLYQFNSAPLTTVADSFQSNINGTATRFEITNPNFDPLGYFVENNPDPIASKNIIYRNDSSGNSSPNTGFFAYFKQGNLQYSDYRFDYPLENRIIDINVNNINELDVWVQEINDSGYVTTQWTKVPSTDNIAYSNIDRQNRKIFSVITRENDQISIKFGDGRFGQSPVGLFRIWYRASNGLRYQIRPTDMENIQITIPYLIETNSTSQQQTLTLTFSLQYGVTARDVGASVPKETNEQIQQRAGQVYYTQNRMVNGEDYNIFPLQYGNIARKVKAINRTYSGQSRYIDINDPTGRYQNTNLFSDDGILYQEYFNRNSYESLPTIKSALEIVTTNIQPLLNYIDLRDFFLANYSRPTINNNPLPTKWKLPLGKVSSKTGQFVSDKLFSNTFTPQIIGPGASNNYAYLSPGAFVKFVNPSDTSKYIWTPIVRVTGNGTDINMDANGFGPVMLATEVPEDWIVELLIPAFRPTFSSEEIVSIQEQVNNKSMFALRYDPLYGDWIVVGSSNINLTNDFSLTNAGSTNNTNADASWIFLAQYLPSQGYWQFTTRNLRYIFESVADARFFFVNNFKVTDIARSLPLRDYIRILKYNTKPAPSNAALAKNYEFQIIDSFVQPDGYIEPRRVQVSFTDSNNDGIPDDPDTFVLLVDPRAQTPSSNLNTRYVYQKLVSDSINGYQYYEPIESVITFDNFSQITTENLITNQVCYVIATGIFYQRQSNGSLLNVSAGYKAYLGRSALNFQWKHYVPEDQRIDPSTSNIIDIFVLTENYYQASQDWLRSVNRSAFPLPPGPDELRQQLAPLEASKMTSDEVIWQSAKFKLLFGSNASEELQAQFMVIKVPGTTVTDNEVKQKVINAINQFFTVDNWNFGESFYFTELSAYIHQTLATVVASVVIKPNVTSNKFGNLFVVRAESDELFLSTASVSDVIIVQNYTAGNINIGL